MNIELLESSKPLGNKNNWGALETMTIGYGHGFAITPLHLVKAYSSIANNGNESIPTLILKKQNLNKNKILQNNDTSKFFLKLLKSVVTKTNVAGPNVKIEGYDIGGKTGTAMLVNKKGGYYRDRDLTSFIGIFPIEKPKYIVLTIIEYPKKPINSNIKTTGGTVNAPLVKKIILDMIRILNIPKYKNSDILKADINSIYYLKNATL